MNEKLSVVLLLGTNRDGRTSARAAKWLYGKLEEHADIEPKWFDVRDFDLPDDDYGQATKDRFPEYKEAIENADALVIVTPEYNHGYPGRLKSVLDTLLPEYKHRAVGIAAVSAGPWGGARVAENILPVLGELGLVVIKPTMLFPKAGDLFSEDGEVQDSSYNEHVSGFLDELTWMARTLRAGRRGE